jgi:hypothetical protein
MSDRDRRLAFAIPPIAEPREETERLDPADADDRALLIAAAHPEAEMADDPEINRRLHLTIHEIVATQIVDNDPPEVWATAEPPQLWDALQNQQEYELQAHRAALAALPDAPAQSRTSGAPA